jgi:hypothetical protein
MKVALRVILVMTVLSVVIVYVYLHYYEDLKSILTYSIGGLESIVEGGGNQSVNIRSSQIQWALENNGQVIIGAGIGKGVIMLESFYSLYYYRYGLSGVLFYLCIPLATAIAAYKIAKKEYKINQRIAFFYLSLCVYYIVFPVSILSSCNQDTPKTAFLFYGLIGLVFYKYNVIKNENPHYHFPLPIF